jgi:ribosome maturation factor RimP
MGQSDLRPLLAPVVAASGCDLEDLVVSLAGKRRRIELVIDRDGGVDLDLIAEVSRAASAALDEGGVGDAPYTLEVTSPGIDRPLSEGRHWRRNVGRLVEIDMEDGTTVTGRVQGVTAEGEPSVAVVIDGDEQIIALRDLTRGRVQVEFKRPTEGS